MSDRQPKLHELLLQNLAELNLKQIAPTYREVLDEAARCNSSMLEVLSSLVASEMTLRRQKALHRRILQAKLPNLKTLAEPPREDTRKGSEILHVGDFVRFEVRGERKDD